MAAPVFCVKRRIEDEPYDTFVLNCKRFKAADADDTPATSTISSDGVIGRTFLKFAATLESHDDISAKLCKIKNAEPDRHPCRARKPSNTIAKMRQQYKNDTQNQRFKILDGTREIDTSISSNGDGDDDIGRVKIIDIVKEPTGQLPSLGIDEPVAAAAEKFVYDLYFFDGGVEPQEWNLETISSISPLDDLVWQTQDETLNNSDFDSEDSNDEANWRNDYPDAEDESVGEDDMRRAMQDLNVGDDGLSSDNDGMAYGQEPVHFLDASESDIDLEDDDYTYFKKFGRMKQHSQHYRNGRSSRRDPHDTDDDCSSDDDSDRSSVSELISCHEDD